MSIHTLRFYCALQGQEFDPVPLLNVESFEIMDYYCLGDIASKGRFKGQPLEDAYICFRSKEGGFDEFVNKLYRMKELMLQNKAERRELHLFLGYQNQCNWWFDAEILRIIGELNLDLTLSCSEIDDSSAST